MKLTRTNIVISVLSVLGLIFSLMLGLPVYSVWRAEKTGLAEFRQAEQNRRVRVEEARAVREAAALLAEAEVERARGVAQANEIVSEGLGGPEGYLRYLFIQGLQEAELGGQVIYVPTEAMMPVLEAGRFLNTSNSP